MAVSEDKKYGGDRMLPIVMFSLVVGRVLHAVGVFLTSDVLHEDEVPVVLYVWCLLGSSALVHALVQRLWKHQRLPDVITSSDRMSVVVQACLATLAALFWHWGLKYYGPMRTIVASESAEVTLVTATLVLFGGMDSSSKKFRGALLVVASYAVMSWTAFRMDKNALEESGHATEAPAEGAEAQEKSILEHAYLMGISRNVFGLLFVVLSVLLTVAHTSMSRKLSAKFGGARRLSAMSAWISTAMLTPFALWELLGSEARELLFSGHNMLRMGFVIGVLILNFYVRHHAQDRAAKTLSAASHTKLAFTAAFVTAYVYELYHFDTYNALSLLCFTLIIVGVHIMSLKDASDRRGTEPTIPLYGSTGPQKPRESSAAIFRSVIHQIVSSDDSRLIFLFLCGNLVFMGVEMFWGFWTNSLSMISDSFHMLFDCTALAIALYCTVMSKWSANTTYSFGYGRYEIISGFINGVFLIFIALFIVVECIDRFLEPPVVHTGKLLLVAVLGLAINLVGIFAFRDSHHGHSHGGSHHGHSHGGNMSKYGVYLHLIADALGSIGVIISSLCIDYFGWFIMDPICSMVTALLILGSVFPLIGSAAKVLLQTTPFTTWSLESMLRKVEAVEDVVGYRDPHFWQQAEEVFVGSIHVHIRRGANEQKVLQQVLAVFKANGVNFMTVQVEDETFFNQTAHFQSVFPSVPSLAAPGPPYPFTPGRTGLGGLDSPSHDGSLNVAPI